MTLKKPGSPASGWPSLKPSPATTIFPSGCRARPKPCACRSARCGAACGRCVSGVSRWPPSPKVGSGRPTLVVAGEEERAVDDALDVCPAGDDDLAVGLQRDGLDVLAIDEPGSPLRARSCTTVPPEPNSGRDCGLPGVVAREQDRVPKRSRRQRPCRRGWTAASVESMPATRDSRSGAAAAARECRIEPTVARRQRRHRRRRGGQRGHAGRGERGEQRAAGKRFHRYISLLVGAVHPRAGWAGVPQPPRSLRGVQRCRPCQSRNARRSSVRTSSKPGSERRPTARTVARIWSR